MANPSTPTPRIAWAPPREDAPRDWSWVGQAVTGTAVLGLVTLHMVANHFVVPEGLRDFA